MRRTVAFIALSIGMILVSSCGDDSQGRRRFDKSQVQDVTNIKYGLVHTDITVEATYTKGGRENIHKVIDFDTPEAKDKVRRIIDGTRFVLVVNDKPTSLNISSDQKIAYNKDDHQNDKICNAHRRSNLHGQALDDTLDLQWEFIVEMEGENCSQTIIDSFFQFQNDELDQLNLLAAKDAINALDQSRKDAKRIRIVLSVQGETF